MNEKQRADLVRIAKEHKEILIDELEQVNAEIIELRVKIARLESRTKKLKTDIVLIDMALANTMLP